MIPATRNLITMLIRTLTPADAAAYRELRLAALRDHPEAFSTDYREDAALPLAEFEKRLTPGEPNFTFGAWDGDQLVGIATLVRSPRLRHQFRATIAAMYVVPSHRCQGVARKLLAECAQQARRLPEVEEVCLCITVGNESARRTYIAFGFQPEFVEPRYFKYEGRYYDLEWMRLPLG